MEKKLRYAIRKTTVGVGSVAVAAVLAAQSVQVQAQEGIAEETEELVQPTAGEVLNPAVDSAPANDLNLVPITSSQAASDQTGTKESESVTPPIDLEISNETVPYAVQAMPEGERNSKPREGVAKTPDGNVMTETENSVSADENKVGTYRDSDLSNNGIVGKFIKEDNGTTQEGVTVNILNPSPTVEDKKKFGIQIDIDRESSERTYNGVYVTDSQRGVPIRRGSQGELVKPGEDSDFEDVNYPTSEEEAAKIDHNVNVGNQVTININGDEEFLKDLNNTNNKKTNFAWKHNYVRDNPVNKAFDGSNFEAGFSVNPYPNENKNLSIIRVTGDTNIEKVPVKGQYIKTGARIENLGEEDYIRVTSEVYHPDGTVVDPKEAQAILVAPDNIDEMKEYVGEVALGDIILKMPKGALEDSNSIFNNDKFSGIQNLRAEFFARPRTEEEFKRIVEDVNAEQGYIDKYYVGTGAGTEIIKHNGQDITIDKQGIARYDHYNTLGTITINLDDTLYYDQTFDRKLTKNTDKVTPIKPGETVEIAIDDEKTKENFGSNPYGKTQDQMNEAEEDGRARGTIDKDFIARAEKQGWKIERDEVNSSNPDHKYDISKFKITPPADAAPGDFIAIPITYTYTNGSTDTEWFHFVVQDTVTNKPEYFAKVGYQGDQLVSKPVLPSTPSDLKKVQPEKYELEEGATYTDNKGNVWSNVSIDPNTGVVTATVPENANIQGGEELFVPVKVKYINDKGEDHYETVQAQFIARTPEVDDEVVVNEVDTEIPFNSKEEFDEELPLGTIKVINEGTPGTGKVQFKQHVVNGQKGLIDENGTFIPGDDKFFTDKTTVTEPVDRLVKVGVKPAEETVTIPRKVEVEVDPTMEPTAEPVVVEEGEDGLVTVKTVRNPKTGAVTIIKEETKKASPKKVKIGTKTTGTVTDTDDIPFDYTVEFDPDFYTNYPDAEGNYKIVTPGQAGKNKKTWTIVNSQIVGEPTVERTEPTNAVIKVGQKDYTGTFETVDKDPIPFETKYQIDSTMDPTADPVVVQEGELGEQETTTIHTIKNGEVTKSDKGEAKQTKAPKEQIVKIGAKTNGTHQVVEDIPFKVEVKKDPSLKKGEWKYEQDENGKDKSGVVGSQEKTLTIENSKVTATSDPTVTKPAENAIILVGNEDFTGIITHSEDHDVPFEVEIRENPELKAGESKVVQPGKKGSYKLNYSQNIKNGEADGEPTTTKSDEVAPTKHIIEVGTQPAENQKTVSSEVSIEIKYVYDNTKATGTAENGTFTPGKVKTVVTNKYNPKTGEIETKEETVVTNAIQEVIIGTHKYTGTLTHEIEEEIPYETEVVFDDSLEHGQMITDQQGKNGLKTIKIVQNFEDGNKTTSSKEESITTQPTTKKVRVGTKTDGKIIDKELVPFETKIEKDPSLKKGEWKYKLVDGVPQAGDYGEKERIITIENSQVKEIGDYKQTKAPKPAVILVGDEDFTGEVTHTEKHKVPFDVEYIYDDKLEVGTTKVEKEGVEGSYDLSFKQNIKNGAAEGEATIEKSNEVAAQNEVVRIGTKPVVKEVEIPFNTDYKVNKNLAPGEVKETTKGVNGKKTFTTTFDKTTGEATTAETTENATNRVVEIGPAVTNGTHEVTEDIPFEVEVKYDPSLAKGEWKYEKDENGQDKSGVKGSQKRTLTIENSVVTNTSDPVQTKAPEKAVILVGSKDLTGTLEYVDKDKVPFETEVTIDPSLKPNEIIEDQAGVLGETETKVTRTITNGQAGEEVRGETTQTKAPVNRKIRIGAKTDGTYTYTNKKPFDVEVRVNPELKKGEHKIIQEGVAGEEEYTVTIENSKITQTSEAKETKAAVNEIIEVGSQDFTGEITHENTCPLPFETEVVYDETLDAGTRVVDQEGTPGSKTTKTTFKIKNGSQDGEPTTVEKSKTDPVNRKVRVGIKAVTKEVEIPFNTDYEVDPTLESGKIEEVVPGANGKKIITTRFDKETGKLVVSEEDTQATNRKLKIGAKTDGTHTYTEEIPFKVIVKEDPALEAGQTREEGGIPGKKEVTVTIENSKLVGDPVEKTVTEAVDKVIYVGTKPNKDMCPLPEDPSQPDQPGSEDPTDPGTGEENPPLIPEEPEFQDPSEVEEEKPEEPDTGGDQPGTEYPEEPGGDQTPGTGETPGTDEKPSQPDQPSEPTPGEETDQPSPGREDQPGTGEEKPQPEKPENPDESGQTNPDTPGTDEKPTDPETPGTGEETPEQPGTEDPTEPGTDEEDTPIISEEPEFEDSGKVEEEKPAEPEDPSQPDQPSKDEPSKAGTEDPTHPDPSNPESPDTPDKDDEKAEEPDTPPAQEEEKPSRPDPDPAADGKPNQPGQDEKDQKDSEKLTDSTLTQPADSNQEDLPASPTPAESEGKKVKPSGPTALSPQQLASQGVEDSSTQVDPSQPASDHQADGDLPQTGSALGLVSLSAAGLSILSGFGLLNKRRRK